MDTQCKRASARAHLRTQTVRYPNLSIQLLVKSVYPCGCSIRSKLFPYFFFPLYFPSFRFRSFAFLFFLIQFFFFPLLLRPLASFHRSIDRSLIFPFSDRRVENRGEQILSSFFFFSLSLVYIFRFQRDISLMQFWFCSLLAQWNRGGVGCETRGRVRGEVLLAFFFFFLFLHRGERGRETGCDNTGCCLKIRWRCLDSTGYVHPSLNFRAVALDFDVSS